MLNEYLENGYQLIRLRKGSKQPAGEWDKGELEQDLKAHDGGYGVLTGESGIIVLDVDTHGDNPLEGYESITKLANDYGNELPATFEVSTPSGGTHYYYKLPPFAKDWVFDKQVKAYPSVDFQCGKTYVVAAGTTFDNGSYIPAGGNLKDLATAPEWLLRVYKKVKKQYKPAHEQKELGKFLQDVLQGAGEGSRNVWMTQICGKLISTGISFKEVKQWFYLINQISCRPQLPKSEIETIYNSIIKSEQRNRKAYKEEKQNV